MAAMAALRDASGEEDLGKVKKLEMIFADFQDYAVLRELRNVRELTLIDTKMEQVPPELGALGATLVSLTLSKQPLSKLTNLSSLANLVDLFLPRNQVEKIEGLDGCPKLRRLWLTENRVAAIEGLENLVDLRELHLQGNKISQLSGLESNANLRVLDVSRNCIAKLPELERLGHLSQLRELSLQSDTFGTCPVVFQEHYQRFTICTLRQLQALDGQRIKDEDRAEAEDCFLQKALEFNDRVDELHRQHREQLRSIEMTRLGNVREAEALRRELVGQFSKLQDVVAAGREKIRKEQNKQLLLREQNVDQLKTELIALKKQHRDLLNGLIEEEKRAMEQEEKVFSHLSRRARLELNESVAMAELAQGVEVDGVRGSPTKRASPTKRSKAREPGVDKRVAFQVLCSEATNPAALPSELKTFAARVRRAQRRTQAPLLVFRASKVFSAYLHRAHVSLCKAVRDREEAAAQEVAQAVTLPRRAAPRLSEPTVCQLFLAVPDLPTLKQVVQNGPAVLAGDGTALVACTDPRTAAALAGESSDMRGMFRVVECQAVLATVFDMHQVGASQVFSQEGAASVVKNLPIDCTAARLREDEGELEEGETPACVYVLRAQDAPLLLPSVYAILAGSSEPPANQHDYDNNSSSNNASSNSKSSSSPPPLVVQEPGLEQMIQSVAATVSDFSCGIPADLEARLDKLEEKIASCVNRYEDRVKNELDPATADSIESLEKATGSLDATLGGIREQINREKARQEQILRDFQQAL